MPTRDDFITEFGLYSRIQDRLLLMGNYENIVVLNANLILYTEDKKRNKTNYYYTEIGYYSEKFGNETKKIKRDPDMFLSLENTSPIGSYREFITIRPKDLEFMYLHLIPYFEEVIREFDTIFQTRDGKLYVTEKARSIMVDIGTKSLVFRPGINKTFTEEFKPTLEMFMNAKEDNKVSLSFDQVYGFMYIIRRFNLYEYAAAMMNYIGRPPANTNLINMVDQQDYNQVNISTFSNPSKRRFIAGTEPREAKKSFFLKNDGED